MFLSFERCHRPSGSECPQVIYLHVESKATVVHMYVQRHAHATGTRAWHLAVGHHRYVRVCVLHHVRVFDCDVGLALPLTGPRALLGRNEEP